MFPTDLDEGHTYTYTQERWHRAVMNSVQEGCPSMQTHLSREESEVSQMQISNWNRNVQNVSSVTISKELTKYPSERVSFKNVSHLGSNDVRKCNSNNR